ncbi:MAG: zinc-ribbon domain-containing protein [Candidatus Avispirillum sp.]
MADTKEKRYIIDNPALMAEWDFESNFDYSPYALTEGSKYKVNWRCSNCSRIYSMRISHRANGHNCPYCAGRLATELDNLQVANPTLAEQWHPSKNLPLMPTQVKPNSSKTIWWQCNNGHEWQATVVNRHNKNSGCPYCSGHKATHDYNLCVENPELAREWHPSKNFPISPVDVVPNSHLVVWWMCERGHEWKATIDHRNKNRGCPMCAKELHTSFPEQAIYFYIKKLFPNSINSYKTSDISEIDIYIPDIKVGIEYNGYFWHKGKADYDSRKREIILSSGISLIRVIEDKSVEYIEQIENDIYFNPIGDYRFLDDVIKIVLNIIHSTDSAVLVSTTNDRFEIWNQYLMLEKERSLEAINPLLASEWNFQKNGSLMPSMVSPLSGKKVWWICKNKHEWQASVSNRTKGRGCPYCAGRYATKTNNFAVSNLPILSEWHPTKNNDLSPEKVLTMSSQVVWWKCENGHEWQSSLRNRASNPQCPFCKQETNEKTWQASLIHEWNFEKNEGIYPYSLSPHSNKIVWWKCEAEHEWQARINNRMNGATCPFCANISRSQKHSLCKDVSLAVSAHPELMLEWSPRNSIDPYITSVNSHKKALWICEHGHEWFAEIKSRFLGSKCPYCTNKKVLTGYNDLATTNPDLLLEWNYCKNTDISPEQVSKGSGTRVWWKCNKCGHEWQTSILNRTRGTDCPKCSRKARKNEQSIR